MRMTKIHATIGPSSWDKETLRNMILSGLDGCRINFSHTERNKAEFIVQYAREFANELDKAFTIRQDLQGPRLRIGSMARDVTLKKGQIFALELGKGLGNEDRAFFSSQELYHALNVGNWVILADGHIRLKVIEKVDLKLICEVVVSAGALGSRKGINVPGVRLNSPAFTNKDKEDLEVGLRCGVDVVSLSFVKSAQDVRYLRSYINKLGYHSPVIAKIESRQAIEQLDEIIEEADGISIARGDLQVECSLAEVPHIQRHIVRRCQEKGKLVLVGSGVLSSMKANSVPSLGDVADVFLAVESKVDVISLSDETAIGKYPVQCIQTMDQLITEMEAIISQSAQQAQGVFGIYHSDDALKISKMLHVPVVSVQKNRTVGNWLAMHRGVFVTFMDDTEPSKLTNKALCFAVKSGILGKDEEFRELQRPHLLPSSHS
jgi:pyruvate kinase